MTGHFLRAAMVAAGLVLAGTTARGEEPHPELHPRVRIQTNLGAFTVELDAERAPVAVIHFMDHVERGFYQGLVFHRVLEGGLIQGGSYLPSMEPQRGGTRAPQDMELVTGMAHLRGTMALVHVPGRSDYPPAEFFINLSNNTGLDESGGLANYTVIGQVVDGWEAVERIGAVAVDVHPRFAAGLSPVVPRTPVVMEEVSVLRGLNRGEAIRLRDERIRRAEESAAEQAAEQERNYRAALDRLDQAAREAGREVVTTASGLKYVDIRPGRGAQPLYQDRVVIHFRGTLLNGVELNNTFVEEKPATRRVAEMVEGLREGLNTMSEGGRRMFLVPPELAFKSAGIPGRVPPNAWMVYEIELLEVLPPEP